MDKMSDKTTKKEKILCMFSGGLDSLGAVYVLLKDKQYQDYDIHIHHLILRNIEFRGLAEMVATHKVIEYLKSHDFRPFEYTESQHDYRFMQNYFIYDTVWYAFMAANMMINDPALTSLAVGRTKDDQACGLDTKLRAYTGHDVFHATLPLQIRYERPYIFPVVQYSKKEIWIMLPEALRKLSWSCRRPVYKDNQPFECGKCTPCKELLEIRGN